MDICKDDGADWEELSMDSAQWNVLLRQLEDLSMLDFVLQQRIKVKLNALPHSLKWKSMPISLHLLLEKGRGKIKNLMQN
jgi:Rab3 GTPase-activating protein regulatory subunit C-terminus